MSSDRTIGRTVKVKTYQALVELAPDTSSYVKSSLGGLYAIAVINSFVIIPVGSERVVAVVTGLDMAEDQEASVHQRQMLVIAKPRRTMWVSMIGTIVQKTRGKSFEYGVRRYPELDNPVWFANAEDLDVIFGTTDKDEPKHVKIGTSPIFTEYDVRIDVDRFFGKHAAILGNTGAGKSCTVTAVIKAVLDRGMPNAHFVIFDTNNEYERAFTVDDETAVNGQRRLYNRIVLRNDGDTPSGLFVPHWFMNSSDYLAFFRPGEAAQAPLLFRAIGVARSQSQQKSALLNLLGTVEDAANQMEVTISNPVTGPAAYYAKPNLRTQIDAVIDVINRKTGMFESASSAEVYIAALGVMRETAIGQGALDAYVDDAVRTQVGVIREQLVKDRRTLSKNNTVPIGVDSPVHFDFGEFVDTIFEEQLARESQRDQRLRSYVGTLQLRLEQARQDPRYAFLFHVEPFRLALASFLRLLFGLDPRRNFEDAPPPWKESFERDNDADAKNHQITILDLSQLASEVLENVTALVGRLILEFMQRLPNELRGTFPVVLVLEEAHHYIPAKAPLERQQRARDVFEKIAKEGRKYGLSLVVASQRPSELSRTVLAQCNSFIVHRIQNPDDQDYFKSVISGINRELLDQLPALAQQQAIVLGDCVRLPLQVRMNDVAPRPRSDDPQFVRQWSRVDGTDPDIEAIVARWEGEAEQE